MVGYAEIFALDTSAAWSASRHYRYDDIVFVLPAWPDIYVTDGDRRMTFESAQAFGDRVREVYLRLGLHDHRGATRPGRDAHEVHRRACTGPHDVR